MSFLTDVMEKTCWNSIQEQQKGAFDIVSEDLSVLLEDKKERYIYVGKFS